MPDRVCDLARTAIPGRDLRGVRRAQGVQDGEREKCGCGSAVGDGRRLRRYCFGRDGDDEVRGKSAGECEMAAAALGAENRQHGSAARMDGSLRWHRADNSDASICR